MSVIYILSDASNSIEKYKVGSHHGSLEGLKHRYITLIPRVIIHYFIYVENARHIETMFKYEYSSKRMENINNRLSEWLIMPLTDIFNGLFQIIHRYTTKDFYTSNFQNTCIMILTDDSDIINYWKEKHNRPTHQVHHTTFEFFEKPKKVESDDENYNENIVDDDTFLNNHKNNLININLERSRLLGNPSTIECGKFIYKLSAIKQLCSLLNISKTYNEDITSNRYPAFNTKCMKAVKFLPDKEVEVNDQTKDTIHKVASVFDLKCSSNVRKMGAIIKIISKVLFEWSGAKIKKINKTQKGSGAAETQVSYTSYIIITSSRMLKLLEKIKPFNTLENLVLFIENDDILNTVDHSTLSQCQIDNTGEQIQRGLECSLENEPVKHETNKQQSEKIISCSNQMTITELKSDTQDITSETIQLKTLPEQHSNVSREFNDPVNQNIISSESQMNLIRLKSNIDAYALELLVDFTLHYHRYIDTKHLVRRIRQVGYEKAFGSLHIGSKPITKSIDKYLRSLKIPGLCWKFLNIKRDSIFPDVRTKYDY